MSLFDSALGYLGLSRSRGVSASLDTGRSFSGARGTRRMRSREWSDAGPNAALLSDGQELRKRARQLYRDHPWVKSAADKLVANCVGTGRKPAFRANSKLSDKKKRAALELLDHWSPQADSSRAQTFYELQRTALLSWIVAGECFARFVRRRASDSLILPLQIQLLEPDQLPFNVSPGGTDTSKIVAGMEVDRFGAPVAYFFLKEHPQDRVRAVFTADQLVRVPISQVIHLFDPKRANQLRGETLFAPDIIKLHQLQTYEEFELDRKAIASAQAGFIKNMNFEETGTVNEGDEQNDTEVSLEFGPGTIMRLEPGEEFQSASADDIPGEYDTYVSTHGKQIAASLGLSYGDMTADYRDASYSSERAASIVTRRVQEAMASRMDAQFCQPIWMAVIDEAIRTGALKDAAYPGNRHDYELISWSAPALALIDPEKQNKADQIAVRNNWVSRSQMIRERGGDPDEVDAEIAADQKRAERLEIVTEGPVLAPEIQQKDDPPPPPKKPKAREETIQ